MVKRLEDEKIKTVIIPGNHDVNLNNRETEKNEKKDHISLLLGESEYVKGYCDTRVVRDIFSNLEICIFSVIDGKFCYPSNDNTRIKVAIIHESIKGATYYNNYENNEGKLSVGTLKKYFDISLLGDIHKP